MPGPTTETVLVSGATGFIASQIIYDLLGKGYQVNGTMRNTSDEEKVKVLMNLRPEAKDNLKLFQANLTSAEGWDEAVKGCTYVLHTASPVPIVSPKDEDEVIKPAVEGTMIVLEAAKKAGTVKRVVVTSSVSAVSTYTGRSVEDYNNYTFTEEDWINDETSPHPYAKSKVRAERAAWAFVKEHKCFELSVICPAFVLGTMHQPGFNASSTLIKKLLNREVPVCGKISFHIVDVRDVSAAHLAAMVKPAAAGQRYVVAGPKENNPCWLADVSNVINGEFSQYGYNAPTKVLPWFVMKALSWFDPTIDRVLPQWDRLAHYDCSKSERDLGINYHPPADAIVTCCHSMIDRGYVAATPGYQSRENKQVEDATRT
eukprot:GFYU01004819.1.p1 GENE.GFYU01004819.1~~GFYU01004819.1.p1  ORF type:complete len:372 (+),score=97.63 GFYU01004819.1:71-1186(+)